MHKIICGTTGRTKENGRGLKTSRPGSRFPRGGAWSNATGTQQKFMYSAETVLRSSRMYQPEVEDMLPRAAPAPMSNAPVAPMPTVPELSLMFGPPPIATSNNSFNTAVGYGESNNNDDIERGAAATRHTKTRAEATVNATATGSPSMSYNEWRRQIVQAKESNAVGQHEINNNFVGLRNNSSIDVPNPMLQQQQQRQFNIPMPQFATIKNGEIQKGSCGTMPDNKNAAAAAAPMFPREIGQRMLQQFGRSNIIINTQNEDSSNAVAASTSAAAVTGTTTSSAKFIYNPQQQYLQQQQKKLKEANAMFAESLKDQNEHAFRNINKPTVLQRDMGTQTGATDLPPMSVHGAMWQLLPYLATTNDMQVILANIEEMRNGQEKMEKRLEELFNLQQEQQQLQQQINQQQQLNQQQTQQQIEDLQKQEEQKSKLKASDELCAAGDASQLYFKQYLHEQNSSNETPAEKPEASNRYEIEHPPLRPTYKNKSNTNNDTSVADVVDVTEELATKSKWADVARMANEREQQTQDLIKKQQEKLTSALRAEVSRPITDKNLSRGAPNANEATGWKSPQRFNTDRYTNATKSPSAIKRRS